MLQIIACCRLARVMLIINYKANKDQQLCSVDCSGALTRGTWGQCGDDDLQLYSGLVLVVYHVYCIMCWQHVVRTPASGRG